LRLVEQLLWAAIAAALAIAAFFVFGPVLTPPLH
jgi:hypothetical protein